MQVPQRPNLNFERKTGGHGKPPESPFPWQWNVEILEAAVQTKRTEGKSVAEGEGVRGWPALNGFVCVYIFRLILPWDAGCDCRQSKVFSQ